MNVQNILEAARADSIPEGQSGPWHIEKNKIDEPTYVPHRKKVVRLMPGTYTYLLCVTEGDDAQQRRSRNGGHAL